jgi:peptide/nickel transport system ATP-binding protein
MLLDSVPDLAKIGSQRASVAGEVPSPINPPPGCAFHPRCPFASERCRSEVPLLRASEHTTVACHAVEEGRLPAWK